MISRFSRLFPYMRANRRMLALGGAALVTANYLDVKVLVMLGSAVDALHWDEAATETSGGLTSALAWIVPIAVAGAAARFWMRRLIIGVSREVEYVLRDDLFSHLQKLSPSFYHRYPTGDLMARMTNDLEAVRLVVGPAVMYLSSTAVLLPMTTYQMIRISAPLTAITFVPLLMIAPIFYFFSRRIHMRFLKVQETFSEISTRVQEALTGIRIIKSYAREEQETKRFDTLSRRFVGENIKLAILQGFFNPMLGLMVGLSLLSFIWTGALMISTGALGGEGLTPGHFVSFFVLLMANIWPLAAVGWVLSLLERGSASMGRIDAIFNEQPDIVDPPAATPVPEPMRGHIEVRDLTFAYPGIEEPTLRGVSIDLPAGKTLGLTGPVGCGKSTLASLLARRHNPPRGSVLIDGLDIMDWPLRPLRAQTSIVDQEPFVFSDSIRSNIAYGLQESGDAAVDRAIEISRLSNDLKSFPAGYETMLGERGINLSGGQRQRSALARALATDPALLILDDALAAVDTHTEEEILAGLADFMRGRTTVLISHRIRAVSITDHIIYLEAGRIAEQGTHAELVALGGKYAELARKQQLAEEIEATA